MTREDTKHLLMMIEAAYPNFKISDATTLINAWYITLQEFNANEILLALETFKRTDRSGFAPQVGQLIDCVFKAQDSAQMGAVEAWGIVSRAIRNSGYHAQEEFDKLPDICKKVVGSPSQLHNWALTDMVMLETNIARQFQFAYETEAKREREFARYPMQLQGQIQALTQQTLAALPQWENPTPVVVAKVEENRATADEIDSHVGRLRGLLGG